jgi:hypothetical protein
VAQPLPISGGKFGRFSLLRAALGQVARVAGVCNVQDSRTIRQRQGTIVPRPLSGICFEDLLRPLTAAIGPKRRFTAVQQDVCNGGQTGRLAGDARTAAFDPNETLACVNSFLIKERLGSGLADLRSDGNRFRGLTRTLDKPLDHRAQGYIVQCYDRDRPRPERHTNR